MKFRVRKAERGDANTLLTLIRALAEYEKLDSPTLEAQDRLVEDGWPEVGPPRFVSWLVEEIDSVDNSTSAIGYAITFFTYSSFLAHPTLYIEDIFILPERRRNRAGTILFAALMEEARRQQCGRIEWVVLDWNTSAQQFYQKLGAAHLTDWQCYRLTLD